MGFIISGFLVHPPPPPITGDQLNAHARHTSYPVRSLPASRSVARVCRDLGNINTMADAGPAGNNTGAAGGTPPPPPTPVYPPISGENNKDELITSLAVVASFATVIMGLRYFCKIRYAKGFGTDDCLLLTSWVSWFLFV